MSSDNPQTAEEYFYRGRKRQNDRDLDGAIDDYTESIRLSPNSVAAYGNRGNIWLEKGDYDKAITDYSQAIGLKQDDARAWGNRGYAWHKKGKNDNALADLNEAIRLNPSSINALNNRGYIWYEKGEYDKAIADLDEAIRLDPKDIDLWLSRGNAQSHIGEHDKAIADYDKALCLDPNRREVIHNRALAMAAKLSEAERKKVPTHQSAEDVREPHKETIDNLRPSKKMRNLAISILGGFLLIWVFVFGFVFWLNVCGSENFCEAKMDPYLFLPLSPAFAMTSLLVYPLIRLLLKESDRDFVEKHIHDPKILYPFLENLMKGPFKSSPKSFEE